MTVVEAVGGILDVLLCVNPAMGGPGADQSWIIGPFDASNDPQAFSCFFCNAIYANVHSKSFNSVVLLQSVVSSSSGLLAPGHEAVE